MPNITIAEHTAIHELALQLSHIAADDINMQTIAGSINNLYDNHLYDNIYNALLLSTYTILPNQQPQQQHQQVQQQHQPMYNTNTIYDIDVDRDTNNSPSNISYISSENDINTNTNTNTNTNNRYTSTSYNGENKCIECGEDMGECNPRQLCGKVACNNNFN